MSRTYRRVPPHLLAFLSQNPYGLDVDATVASYERHGRCPTTGHRTRCLCRGPRDRWHRKRERRLMAAGATPREVKIRAAW